MRSLLIVRGTNKLLMDRNQMFLQLRRQLLEEEYTHLNPRQKAAVFACSRPLLILAGAGSGKTTVLVNKLGYLIRYGNAYHSNRVPEGLTDEDLTFLRDCQTDAGKKEDPRYRKLIADDPYNPYQLLAITFTNKAAGEMRERIEAKFRINASDLWALTFHSTCVRILRKFADLLGYTKQFTIYDENDSLKLTDTCIREFGLSDRYASKFVKSIISKAKGAYLTPDQLETEYKNRSFPKVPALYRRYQQALRESDAMDFDDLIFNTVKVLTEFPQAADAVNHRFRYVLVDEYQDTNPLQYRLVTLLAKGGQLCVVGDDDQSIYRFAGASIRNILDFEHSFPDAEVVRLEQNYRSTQTILNAANSVIANNTNRKGKNLWSDKDIGNKIKYHQMATQYEEGDFIAKNILSEIGGNKKKFNDFCVLYRTHAQSNSIEMALKGNGIPYRVYGGLAFYKRKEVQDLLAYLNVLHNPRDKTRLLRIVNEPKRGIGDVTLDRVAEIVEDTGQSLYDVICHASRYPELQRAADKLEAFGAMIEQLREKTQTTSLSELFRTVVQTIHYEAMLASTYNQNDARSRKENLDELYSSIVQFEKEADEPTLQAYLEQTSLVSATDNLDADADAVVLMTIHCAKGLEFDTVFLAGFEEGLFPSSLSLDEPGGVEEERRLCYVAITRAKRQLYLISPRSRMTYGMQHPAYPSRFLKEIPEEYIEQHTAPVVTRQFKRPEKTLKDRHILKDAVTVIPHAAFNAGFKYQVGQRIRHKIFGEGELTQVTPMASDCLLEVRFDKAGTKKLMANYAKLEVLK